MAKKPSSSKSGTRARSAITGKFVKKSTASRHPRTTVVESVTPARSAKPGKPRPGKKGKS
ncbi:MAG: hypothetical protein HOK98_16695 [Rhodospirillaceae bacterium]|nr:hypothetical protein [Rhodospirillaceae bacterium]MBT5943364.1 hypothetical protein [Rhodospirillaceae bacterium]MBT6403384.1 hypothetical protein [Rhodospirillaceae bacterium]MBT6537813.1 hypothetical protein [Rhodospirillaceae bacterium]MBT6960169.1 hypothetical protein [Rhodospirillaceae bacterium]